MSTVWQQYLAYCCRQPLDIPAAMFLRNDSDSSAQSEDGLWIGSRCLMFRFDFLITSEVGRKIIVASTEHIPHRKVPVEIMQKQLVQILSESHTVQTRRLLRPRVMKLLLSLKCHTKGCRCSPFFIYSDYADEVVGIGMGLARRMRIPRT